MAAGKSGTGARKSPGTLPARVPRYADHGVCAGVRCGPRAPLRRRLRHASATRPTSRSTRSSPARPADRSSRSVAAPDACCFRSRATDSPASGSTHRPAMLDVLRAKDPPPTLRTVMAPMQDFDLAPGALPPGLLGLPRRSSTSTPSRTSSPVSPASAASSLPTACCAFDVFAPDLARIAQREEPEHEEGRFPDGRRRDRARRQRPAGSRRPRRST